MDHPSNQTGESKPGRWWVRFVIVPVVVAAIAGWFGYYIKAREIKRPDAHNLDFKPVRGELFAPGTLALLSDEATDSLQSCHSEVEAAIANGIKDKEFSKAVELSKDLLEDYPKSPRGNDGRACIYSLWAKTETDPETRTRYLDRSQEALQEALDYGFTNYQKLFMNEPHPIDKIQNDSDLKTLLEERPGAVKLLEKYFTEDKPMMNAVGGGCIGIQMSVLLPSGIYLPIDELSVGDTVLSIDLETGRLVSGLVSKFRQLHVKQVLRLNQSLIFTSSHPIRTPQGWLPCGELHPGTTIYLASGQRDTIRSVERLIGDFEVVDLTVEPFQTFVVNGVVVHNKPFK